VRERRALAVHRATLDEVSVAALLGQDVALHHPHVRQPSSHLDGTEIYLKAPEHNIY